MIIQTGKVQKGTDLTILKKIVNTKFLFQMKQKKIIYQILKKLKIILKIFSGHQIYLLI